MISIITPVHAPSARYLIDAYRSLCAQTVDAWEWVIAVTSEGVEIPSEISDDPRVRVVGYTVGMFPAAGQIGRFKREACAAASGEWLLELDADDELFPTALERVQEAFAAGAGFVSSDCAYWLDKGAEGYESRWATYPFAPECGWVDPYPVTFRGMELLAQHAAPDGVEYYLSGTTTDLSTQELEDYIEKIRAWAAEFGYEIPFPNEPAQPAVAS
jgi:glycosyltransferase involved in cell wall biosynthesis